MDDNILVNQQFLETNDEEKACALLFNTYHDAVFAKIDRMMRNHIDPGVDAKDIAQETFIRAWKKRHEVREPEKLQGWLFTIATNLTLNEIRDAERRRKTGYTFVESLESLSNREGELPYVTSLAETDAKQAEVEQEMKAKLLCLLQGKDRKVAELKFAGAEIAEIAETVGPTADAVQKRWERILEWLIPIGRNLDALIDRLSEGNERKIMEGYLDEQPLSEIAKAIPTSRSKVEETVKRVIEQWKKAAKDNPADPVSEMVKNER